MAAEIALERPEWTSLETDANNSGYHSGMPDLAGVDPNDAGVDMLCGPF
ncbi:hypothetical protein [Arthrobacter sp. EM1]|nr:hypothetical protein [Arthrobacter sp. EM1]WGZ81485.1 hypothetical protein QI450_09330 [Arthrobacter sp. EM1]